MKQAVYDALKSALSVPPYVANDGQTLLRAQIAAAARAYHPELIALLLGNAHTRQAFFVEAGGALVFKADDFVRLLLGHEFLPSSFTAHANRIGLSVGGKYLKTVDDVVLDFPYKDCVLAGGQSREENARQELFYHEVLARDEITCLLEPKVFANPKRITREGETPCDAFYDTDNMLIKGNNLLALHSLKRRYAGRVKLIYIDPPYNTGSDAFKYNDRFNHSAWLVFMKNRLEIARELLARDGSIWINIDDNEAHYLKVLGDEVFGRDNFVANVVWQKKSSPQANATWLSDSHDHVLVYAKDKQLFRPSKLKRSEKQNAIYKHSDIYDGVDDKGNWYGRGPWFPGDFTLSLASGQRGAQFSKTGESDNIYPITTPSGREVWPAKGRAWAYVRASYERLLADNRIYFGKNGSSKPTIKRFISEIEDGGVVAMTTWHYSEVGENRIAAQEVKAISEETPFSTPKPEGLLKRIMELSTTAGDIILDFFAGSGTTLAVAHKMGRRWIGIEQMNYIDTSTQARLKKVLDGEQGGISKAVEWQGGGEFVSVELAKWNGTLLDEIHAATDAAALGVLREKLQSQPWSAFVNYTASPAFLFDPTQTDAQGRRFADLPLSEQKQLLVALLDKNFLYANLVDVDAPEMAFDETTRRFNRSYHGGGLL